MGREGKGRRSKKGKRVSKYNEMPTEVSQTTSTLKQSKNYASKDENKKSVTSYSVLNGPRLGKTLCSFLRAASICKKLNCLT